MRIAACLVLAAAVVAGASPGASAADALTPLRVATTAVDSGAQVYYAQDMGFFKKAGFDVEITSVSSGPTIAAGVASGAFDFAQVNVPSLVSARCASVMSVVRNSPGSAKFRVGT